MLVDPALVTERGVRGRADDEPKVLVHIDCQKRDENNEKVGTHRFMRLLGSLNPPTHVRGLAQGGASTGHRKRARAWRRGRCRAAAALGENEPAHWHAPVSVRGRCREAAVLPGDVQTMWGCVRRAGAACRGRG